MHMPFHIAFKTYMYITTSTPPPKHTIGAALVAVYGFLIAVFWIDRIANELVALLEFFGVVWGIQSSILGLTVLAWGNSIGDLVTDVAMAKRGLSNMAITACYAGPVFNMLMGLGIGMWVRGRRGAVENVGIGDGRRWFWHV